MPPRGPTRDQRASIDIREAEGIHRVREQSLIVLAQQNILAVTQRNILAIARHNILVPARQEKLVSAQREYEQWLHLMKS